MTIFYDFTGYSTIPTLNCSLWDNTLSTQYSGAVAISGANLQILSYTSYWQANLPIPTGQVKLQCSDDITNTASSNDFMISGCFIPQTSVSA